MNSPQSEVAALISAESQAMQSKNLERLMPLFSPNVVYFDTVPPLRFAGVGELRDRFKEWFATWKTPITMEIRNLCIVVHDSVAFAFYLNRASGTLRDGREVGTWVRVTSCCERTGDGWLITHEHVSLPIDPQSGRAATDVTP